MLLLLPYSLLGLANFFHRRHDATVRSARRTSQNAQNANFALSAFCELRLYGVLRSSAPIRTNVSENDRNCEKNTPHASKFIADSSPLVIMWVNCCRESGRRKRCL